MRPTSRILDKSLIKQIIDEAVGTLCSFGVEIQNQEVSNLLLENGVKKTNGSDYYIFKDSHVDQAIKSAPSSFGLYDQEGKRVTQFEGDNVHFTPGSAALKFYDAELRKMRDPVTSDYIGYVKVADQLPNFASQSTAFIPSDVNDRISDAYRLYLGLLYGRKPVVTGVFREESFKFMYEMQCIVRGSEKKLAQKPLTMFTCCPTSPLKWTNTSVQNLIDCARKNVPVELVSMPLSGFLSPVTLTGTLIQHCAEILSGLIIHQMASPGAPVLFGASITTFDTRNETTPMGAVESMMMSCGVNEIGKTLGLPTQAYISLSDAKHLDAQAGLETAMGATMATLSGINEISGPGMMEFENCFCTEKLILDNEIAGMCLRIKEGITPKEDFPSTDRMQELREEDHLIISEHTLKYLAEEHFFPGPVIDRQPHARWESKGSPKLIDTAIGEKNRLVNSHNPNLLDENLRQDLYNVINDYAKILGISLPEDALPEYSE
jgi:trimethylamine--corrinoid protein Co-methyltransferase